MTDKKFYAKIVANETVLNATNFVEVKMATIMRKMNIISRCEANYRTEKSTVGLAGIYHSYVLAICKNPGLPQEKLVQYLCINKSNVTRHLAHLELEGYVERRTSDSDKRETLVFPTQRMYDILSEVKAITLDWNSRLAEGIDAEDLKLFHEILDKMLDKAIEIEEVK